VSLGHLQALRAPGAAKLKRPAGTYDVERSVQGEDGQLETVVERRRKPAHGQWSNVSSASATRPAGFSTECISENTFANAKYMRAMHGLKTKHIQVLQALYSPSAHMRDNSRRGLIAALVSRYRVAAVRERAKHIARAVLLGRGSPSEIRALFDIESDQWRASRHRGMLSEIRSDLSARDAAALLAWGAACEGLE
jgi:hypothetical protein